MDLEKLKVHIKLCRSNLRSKKVKCCVNCLFEEEIVRHYPDLKTMFKYKRQQVKNKNE